MKVCYMCKVEKSLDEFYNDPKRKDGRQSKCKACSLEYAKQKRRRDPDAAREAERVRRTKRVAESPEKVVRQNKHGNLMRLFGISVDQYEAMFEKQGGCCLICARHESEVSWKYNTLCVDHCHETGEIRGLLCYYCNLGLGQFRDDPARLEAAMAYLKEHTDAVV